jgi:predicted type IV restriction endonuclease
LLIEKVFPPLTFPPYEHRLREAEGKLWIFDNIRKKFLVLTPEEWVRQHIVNYLINHLNYPKSLIKIEGGLSYNQLAKRSDIVVFDRDAKPWLLIECKAPSVKLSESVIQQVILYNATMGAKHIAVSNGLARVIGKLDDGVTILDEFPLFP